MSPLQSHKIFRADGKGTNKTENNGILNKKSDLSYNPLVDEANHRRNKNSDGIENIEDDKSTCDIDQ